MSSFECKYCNKSYSTKGNLNKHIKSSCKVVNDRDQNLIKLHILSKENTDLKKELLELKKQKIDLEDKLIELEMKSKLIELEAENRLYKEIARQPTTTTTNNMNITNIYKNKLEITFDLNDTATIEDVKEKVRNGFSKEYFLLGQKGMAMVLEKEIFKNNKNKMYICSDASRGIFRFKDKDGNIHIDIKATKLTGIVHDGIKDKLNDILRECIEEAGDNAVYITENIIDIMNLNEDNCDFRNKIINIQ